MNARQILSLIAIGIAITGLSACAAPGERLAAVGLYHPIGPKGEENCETQNHCLVRTDESGLTHVSIANQSMVMVGFSGRGGDVRHYFDYLVTIQNIGKHELSFDPRNVDGYDEGALLVPIKKREGELGALAILTGISMGLGNVHNTTGLQYLANINAQDREKAQAHFSEQKIAARTIPPGEAIAGRLIIGATGEIPKRVTLTIPVGPDNRTVSFDKRDLSDLFRRADNGSVGGPDSFSFDGRWLNVWGNGAYMDICFLRTEGIRIIEECESGESASGTYSGTVATLESGAGGNYRLIAIDENTLVAESPLTTGTYIYERQ